MNPLYTSEKNYPNQSRRSFLKSTVAASALLGGGLLSGCQFNFLDPNMAGHSAAGDGDTQMNGDAMDGMISVHDTNLFHAMVGSGTPMLVMHGGLGLDHEYFRPTLDSWGDFAQLIYFDHRGNGRSDAPDDWESVTLQSMASDADALRAALGMEKVILYGHSYGGFLALEYAMQYQDNLAGLILASTSPNVKYESNMPEWATDEAMSALGAIFSAPMESDEQWAEMWSTALPLYWRDMDAELAADIHNRTHYKAAAWNRASQLLGDFEMKGKMDQITVPTLLLSGRFDFITGPQAHEDMHAEIPNSELVFFEESGHFPFITEAEKYKSVVQEWVAGL